MKILFQGSWKENRDTPNNKEKIAEYCKTLAYFIVKHNHTIVLSSNRDNEKLIADEINLLLHSAAEEVKEKVLFLLPDTAEDIPTVGTVHKYDDLRWWQAVRTYFIQQVDCLIAIGGGKGTSDSIQKGLLANIPVFVAGQINSTSTKTWNERPNNYQYLKPGDTKFTDDLNTTPEIFFKNVFAVLERKAEAIEHSRNIFIVHGRDHFERNKLVVLLKKLDFNPIVLDKEPDSSLTIIEKLERNINNVGFGFILYTPDDIGKLKDGIEKPRSRQNVVFEHGYLFGLLGRGRTCALVGKEVEFPSDLNGLLVEKFSDIEEDSLKIGKVLRAAGYEVDLNKI